MMKNYKEWKQKKEQDEQVARHNWLWFANGYLLLADKGCDAFPTLTKDSVDRDSIVMPIIFNIKHALELMLKYFTIQCVRENYNPKHDLRFLCNDFTTQIRSKMPKREAEEIVETLEQFEVLVDEYHTLAPIIEKVKSEGEIEIEDSENTFLKYPEHVTIRYKIWHPSWAAKVVEADILKIKEDVADIKSILWLFEKRLEKIGLILKKK